MSPTWFITGASNGLGLELILHVLERGHKAIGAVRSKTKSATAVEKIQKAGGSVIELDMTESKESITAKVQSVGDIDYLVNNAGYTILAACEQIKYVQIPNQPYIDSTIRSDAFLKHRVMLDRVSRPLLTIITAKMKLISR